MNLFQVARRKYQQPTEQRYNVDDYIGWMQQFMFNGIGYSTGGMPANIQQTLKSEGEHIGGDFAGRVYGAYMRSGVVFAVQMARQMVFTEARFMMQHMIKNRPGDLYGTPALRVLDEPWPNGTTGSLLSRMLQDVDISGNAYLRITPQDGRTDTKIGVSIERLRPDWVVIMLGNKRNQHTLQVVGYLYYPDGIGGGEDPVGLTVDEVAHWNPIPDPLGEYRGMSWLTPVLRDVLSDSAAVTHKIKYFENGASPSVIVSYDPMFTMDQFERLQAYIESNNVGLENAYKIMHLAGGANAQVIGNSLREVDFKNVSAATETKICAAARVPPVIVGLSEGLQAATYSNYGQARRHFADSWARPMWRSAAGALASIIDVPTRSRLWYDDRDISFLREDEADAAEIQSVKAATISSLISAGFTPDSAIIAVTNDDFTLLQHTGLVSVQLLPPGAEKEEGDGKPKSEEEGEEEEGDGDSEKSEAETNGARVVRPKGSTPSDGPPDGVRVGKWEPASHQSAQTD